MSAPRGGRRPGQRRGVPVVVLIGAVVVALVVGVLVGQAGSGSASAPSGVSEGSDGPARWSGGVPSGFAHSSDGAAEAVASYERAFASPAVLGPGALRRRIEAVAAPDYVATMLAANGPGTRRIAAGAIGVGLAEGIQTICTAVPIGYRVESYTPERAKVLTWGFTLLGNASAVEPGAYFGVTETELSWTDGDWKIAGTRASFGPTPKLVTPRRGLEGFDLLALAKGLRTYGVTP